MVKNGIKFAPGGQVTIYIAYDEVNELIHVHIHDNGQGIEKEDLPKIYSMFGKLRRTAEQNSEGVGMGLEVCKNLVKLNFGTI